MVFIYYFEAVNEARSNCQSLSFVKISSQSSKKGSYLLFQEHNSEDLRSSLLNKEKLNFSSSIHIKKAIFVCKLLVH